MSGTLSREGLLGKRSRRFKIVAIPTGGDVRIRNLTTSEMRALRASLLTRDGKLIQSRADRIQQLLVAACVVDDDGNRLFSDDDALGVVMDELDGAVMACLFSECKTWSGFGVDSDWSAIEDAAKNSEGTSPNGSTAGLQHA